MFKKAYSAANSRIDPSPRLIEDTINKIHKEQLRINSTDRKKFYSLKIVAACIAVGIISVGVLPRVLNLSSSENDPSANKVPGDSISVNPSENNGKIVSKLTAGEHKNQVALSNGQLNFMNPDQGASDRAKLAFNPSEMYTKEYTLEEYIKYLGKDPRPTYMPKDLKALTNYSQLITFYNNGDILYDNFSFNYGESLDAPSARSLTLTVSKDKLPIDCVLYIDGSEPVSNINGHEIRVGYQNMPTSFNENNEPTEFQTMYFSEFIYNGMGYRILSTNLSQEEFVNILLSIVK